MQVVQRRSALGHPLRRRNLAFHDLLEKNHLSPGIGDGPLGQLEDRADRTAEPATGTLVIALRFSSSNWIWLAILPPTKLEYWNVGIME